MLAVVKINIVEITNFLDYMRILNIFLKSISSLTYRDWFKSLAIIN